MNSSPTFYLRLFGSPSVEAEGGDLLTGRVTQRHRMALLALLARAPAERWTRDKLIAYLWPESDAEEGRNLLNVSTYVLRMSLGDDAILSAGDKLRLTPEVVRADVAEFEGALERRDHARAVALYRGPFLDGFFLSEAAEFDQWVERERERLAGRYGKALEALAETAESEQNFAKAAEWWKTRAVQDPYDSRVAIRLMRALDAAGNRAGALQHAAVHQRLLQEEFGTTPPEVAALAERLRKSPMAAAPISIRRSESLEERGSATPSAGALPPSAKLRSSNRWRRALMWIGPAAILLAGAVWAAWPRAAPPERCQIARC